MKEWLLILTAMWGDPALGGEARYHGGSYRTIEACASAMADAARSPRMAVGQQQAHVVKAECVLRDPTANH